ncbi:MAG: serine/threonine-protein kinase [Bacteroidota bacterium]
MSLTPSPERWARLSALLLDALDRPEAERHAFLDAACADDLTLVPEVERLLVAHAEAERTDRFEVGAAEMMPAALERATDSPTAPQEVGPYRLVREVGRGGMGTVWLAERADGLFEQRVAVKLLRTGVLGPDAERRFAAERRILASLDHPHIARLLDGGVTDAGQPYLVMEYIEGQPLTTYARTKQLRLDERLALFRTVCETVAFAHQNLVVHRDLKPSNILVAESADGRPVVKLLDFGIAKLLAEDEDEPVTRTGQALLTPEYAAPEQVRSGTITTATDVYALGVVLYELLVGHRPYAIEDHSALAVERAVLEATPIRPSTAVRSATQDQASAGHSTATDPSTTERWARRLRGDLDTIGLKALRKEPERRYRAAADLADDLRRWAEGLPVTAQPDTTAYRLRKFVQRHRVGVAAGAAFALALVLGLAGTLWQARVAQMQAERSERVLTFLEGMIAEGGADEGDPDTPIGEVIRQAADRVDREFEDDPVVASRVFSTLAAAFYSLGLGEETAQTAQRALDVLPNDYDGPARGRALMTLAVSEEYTDFEAVVARLQDALTHLKDPADAALRAEALAALGDAHAAAGGPYDAAEAAFHESIRLYRNLDHPDLFLALNGLALVHLNTGDLDAAKPLLDEAVALMRAYYDGPHYILAVTLSNLAAYHSLTDATAEAIPLIGESLAMLQATLGPEHPHTISTQMQYAGELMTDGRPAEARVEADSALRLATEHLGLDHAITAYGQDITGRIYCDLDLTEAGIPLLRQSLETQRSLYDPASWRIANSESMLGSCLAKTGALAEAETLLARGYEGMVAARGDEDHGTQLAAQRLRAFCETHGCTTLPLSENES